MIALAVLVPVLLSLPLFGYMWNLFMHVFGAILFMGNITVTAVWASLARRDGRPDTVRFTSRGIVITDLIFTTPGVVMLLLNGGIIGTPYFQANASWLWMSVGLFLASAIVWVTAMVPLQRRMLEIAESIAGPETPDTWHGAVRKWFRWGGVATLLPLLTLVLMVVKPQLW
jgi:uncharacterized membrane protein